MSISEHILQGYGSEGPYVTFLENFDFEREKIRRSCISFLERPTSNPSSHCFRPPPLLTTSTFRPPPPTRCCRFPFRLHTHNLRALLRKPRQRERAVDLVAANPSAASLKTPTSSFVRSPTTSQPAIQCDTSFPARPRNRAASLHRGSPLPRNNDTTVSIAAVHDCVPASSAPSPAISDSKVSSWPLLCS